MKLPLSVSLFDSLSCSLSLLLSISGESQRHQKITTDKISVCYCLAAPFLSVPRPSTPLSLFPMIPLFFILTARKSKSQNDFGSGAHLGLTCGVLGLHLFFCLAYSFMKQKVLGLTICQRCGNARPIPGVDWPAHNRGNLLCVIQLMTHNRMLTNQEGLK